MYTIDNTLTLSVSMNAGASIVTPYTLSGRIVIISGLFPSQTVVYNLTLTIGNVRNPSPAQITTPFVGNIGGDFAEPIDSSGSSVVLEADKFAKCYMTFKPKFVNRTSSMVF